MKPDIVRWDVNVFVEFIRIAPALYIDMEEGGTVLPPRYIGALYGHLCVLALPLMCTYSTV